MRTSRVVTLSLLVMVAALVMAAPAGAETTNHYYSLSTKGQGTPGYALASGYLFFEGKRTVKLRGYATDVCAPDGSGNGYGAYVSVILEFKKGPPGARVVGRDTDGCSTGYNPNPFERTVRTERRIASARVVLTEWDAQSRDLDARAYSRWWGNPFVYTR
jgi:hypothetical protein